eukprot:3513783-Rhodomonas_salina.2
MVSETDASVCSDQACASDFSTGWNATCNFTNMSETVTEPAGELIVSAGMQSACYACVSPCPSVTCPVVSCSFILEPPEHASAGLTRRTALAGYPGIMLCKILYNTTAGQYDGEYPLDPYGRYHTCKEWEMCETLENPKMGSQPPLFRLAKPTSVLAFDSAS